MARMDGFCAAAFHVAPKTPETLKVNSSCPAAPGPIRSNAFSSSMLITLSDRRMLDQDLNSFLPLKMTLSPLAVLNFTGLTLPTVGQSDQPFNRSSERTLSIKHKSRTKAVSSEASGGIRSACRCQRCHMKVKASEQQALRTSKRQKEPCPSPERSSSKLSSGQHVLWVSGQQQRAFSSQSPTRKRGKQTLLQTWKFHRRAQTLLQANCLHSLDDVIIAGFRPQKQYKGRLRGNEKCIPLGAELAEHADLH